MWGQLYEGDTVSLTGEVTRIDGEIVTVRLRGYGIPVTIRDEFVELLAALNASGRKSLRDRPD